MEIVFDHFPDLSAKQKESFIEMEALYRDWNQKINVISRKDIDEFSVRHVLHSLAIHKITGIKAQSVMDIGTGGGFPGIPLALVYPHVEFILVDSIGKKIKVVKEVAAALNLKNVTAVNDRVENIKKPVDLIVSRAVAPAIKLIHYSRKSLKKGGEHLLLKGGDLTSERDEVWSEFLQTNWKEYPLKDYFNQEFFETKKLIQLSNIKA
ncbi:16S rRNA (guanine(527)-N(7))-methyltransferase RsmG [bacterium]|nr:16S rRNA (guanine(527)-N(7))-methyltransferase RsmG [bacterium]